MTRSGVSLHLIITDCLPLSGAPPESLPLLAPYLTGLRPEIADLVGALPVGGINQILLDVLSAAHSAQPCWAAVLPTDPFLGGEPLWRELARRGVLGVVNLATTALVGGEFRRALGVAGLDQDQEFAALAQARRAGLDAGAVVFSHDQALRAWRSGIDRVILHPGPPTRDPALDGALAEAALSLARRLRTGSEREKTLLYRHPAFGSLLDPVLRETDGAVEWGLP
jgi:predicted TIM-barrel enzyme